MRASDDLGKYRGVPPDLRSGDDCERMRPFPVRVWLALLVLIIAVPSAAWGGRSFGYTNVVETARQKALRPYQEPGKIPDFVEKLTYDQWRNIRFKPKKALWHREKLPFEVTFFHLGFLYNRSVAINIVQGGRVKRVHFSPALFTYGVSGLGDRMPKDLGFAGFSINYPINNRNRHDVFAVFLGASYFRAVGAHEGFGLSARGLAVDTAESSGEEFPYFREFWLVRPSPKARRITVYALLDSPSGTGAYKFIVEPGKETVMKVTATLFQREKGKKLGIAPLTSMFFYGENFNIRPADDFRPEVHDSDGLMIASGTGEWIWRPLINPKKLLVTSFKLRNPKGFGLFQRDRNFDHYQDLETHFERRPSTWVVPGKGWGNGRVELVQIPTGDDRNDNIVSYWVPDAFPAKFSYELRWGHLDGHLPPLGRVVATRTSADPGKGNKLFLIDFLGGKLGSLPADARVKADVSVGRADLVGQQLEKNRITGGWRLVLHVGKQEGALGQMIPHTASDDQPVELRASLRLGNEVLTETWSYVDPPD